MTSIVDSSERPASPSALPSIGIWWPMLESSLKREILEQPTAPLRRVVVRRIFDLCEIDDVPLPRWPVRLGANDRAYLAGWQHAVNWV